jgi:hypothetical protein
MVTIPSLSRLLEETDSLPNAVLEKAYTEIATKGGIRRFGRIKEIPENIEVTNEKGELQNIPYRKGILEYLRANINGRNINGDYLFTSRAEQRRLHRISLSSYNY